MLLHGIRGRVCRHRHARWHRARRAVNLGPRRIAGFTSEVLVLDAMPPDTEVVLLSLDRLVANGTRIG